MNRGTLPILSRLRSLQTTSSFASGGARIIADESDRNPLAQLLRTVNETIIGRSLQFDSASGPSLTLDVSGRRVLRLSAAIGLDGADSCLGVETLEDEHKDDLIKLLQALAAPRHELRVTSGPIGRGGEQVSVGLPVALLADLLLIDLNDAGPGEALPEVEDLVSVAVDPIEDTPPPAKLSSDSGSGLAAFAVAFGPDLMAWLVLGEDGSASDGPEEMISHLENFLDQERAAVDQQLDAVSDQPGAAACIMLGATLIEGHSIVCARLRSDLLLGIVDGDGTGAALTAWRSVV
ncbi:MAG: hypothetical protein EON48_01770 [Acetobacteraceae bacterium]|nr:MAG: hypothetical protein EON48_01770 [Acetobacteraceae bacterium]